MVVSISIITFVVLAMASIFLISKKGFSGDAKAFIGVSVVFCIVIWTFLFWAFTPGDAMILAVIFFIPAIALASVLLITLIIIFIFAMTSRRTEENAKKDKDEIEKAEIIKRNIGGRKI